MVSLEGFSQEFQDILIRDFPHVLEDSYLENGCSSRCLDFLEVYSGKGRLSAAVDRVSGMNTFLTFFAVTY